MCGLCRIRNVKGSICLVPPSEQSELRNICRYKWDVAKELNFWDTSASWKRAERGCMKLTILSSSSTLRGSKDEDIFDGE
jgi:hypothetical protein